MTRLARCRQGQVQVGLSREGTALCTAGIAWGGTRAHAPLATAPGGRFHGGAPSSVMPHLLPSSIFQQVGAQSVSHWGQWSTRVVPRASGLLSSQPLLSHRCPISVHSHYRRKHHLGKNTNALISRPGAVLPSSPSLLVDALLSQISQKIFWTECSIALERWHLWNLSWALTEGSLNILVTCFYLQVARMEGRKNRSHHYCGLIYANIFKTWDYPLCRDTCSI